MSQAGGGGRWRGWAGGEVEGGGGGGGLEGRWRGEVEGSASFVSFL